MQENRTLLVGRFLRCVLDQSPGSVLDIGCGDGLLLREFAAAGIPTCGVEFNTEQVTELQRQGFDARQASADSLPFEDGAFDWVTIRHVLHHLVDAHAALTEALRVARTGLVVAEPWTELPVASQREMTRVDRWLRARDRERGMLHGPNVTPAAILAALPAEARTTFELFAPLLRLDQDQLRSEMEEACAGLALTPEITAERDQLLQLAASGQITQPGTAILVYRQWGAVGGTARAGRADPAPDPGGRHRPG